MTAPAEAPPDAELDDDDRAPLLPRPVLVTGLVVGLALVVFMYWGGAAPHVLAAGFLGYVAGFALTAVVCIGLATVVAELLRRHAKRAALASARAAGNASRALGGRARLWAGPRWQRRQDDPAGAVAVAAPAPPAAPALTPAGAPAPAGSQDDRKEPPPMTTEVDQAPPPGRRRLSEQQKTAAPAGWQAVANDAAEFEPESDEELLDWMGAEVAGMFVYGEAVVDLYETCIDGVRLDPVAMAALHDVGDAVADAAAAMAEARQKFATHYAEIREFVAQGGVLPKDGDWITGEGDAA